VTAEQVERLDKIFGAVSSAQTALVMLSEELTKEEFDALTHAHNTLTEAEAAICCQLAKFKFGHERQ
jgi:hypothetical protein